MKNSIKSFKNIALSIFGLFTISFFTSFSANAQSYSTAKYYADQFAFKQMKAICPNTGHDSYSKVIDYDYNSYNDTYVIKVETYWTGGTTFWSDYTTFEIDGTLTVYSDGSYRFSESWADSDTQTVRSNNRLLGIAVVAGTLYAANR